VVEAEWTEEAKIVARLGTKPSGPIDLLSMLQLLVREVLAGRAGGWVLCSFGTCWGCTSLRPVL